MTDIKWSVTKGSDSEQYPSANDPRYALFTFPNGGFSLMHLNWGIIGGAVVGVLAQVLPLVQGGTFGPKAQAIGSAVALLLGAFGVHTISSNAAAAAQPDPNAPKSK